MKDHFLQLLRYTRWADQQIIESLEALDDAAAPERAWQLLDHMGRAQQVWLGRVQGETPLPDIWGEPPFEGWRRRIASGTEDWMGFLSDSAPDDFAQTIRYKNSKGISFENELREVVTHVVNHSTHHRAQVATLIREAGGEPPATDYIFWAR